MSMVSQYGGKPHHIWAWGIIDIAHNYPAGDLESLEIETADPSFTFDEAGDRPKFGDNKFPKDVPGDITDCLGVNLPCEILLNEDRTLWFPDFGWSINSSLYSDRFFGGLLKMSLSDSKILELEVFVTNISFFVFDIRVNNSNTWLQ